MQGATTLAIPKGRPLEESIDLFARAGFDLHAVKKGGRKLIHEIPHLGLRILVLRDADVPTFVEYGAADIGIAGLDVLEEQDRDLYMPLDLGIARCRLAVAEPLDGPSQAHAHLRYATKFPRLTNRHLQQTGVTAEVIKLYGSIEISALTGLADRIVDLVQTGETLKQNRLREIETIMEVSSRMVVNRAAFKLKRARIVELLDRLERVVAPSCPS